MQNPNSHKKKFFEREKTSKTKLRKEKDICKQKLPFSAVYSTVAKKTKCEGISVQHVVNKIFKTFFKTRKFLFI
jgi:hypothetical protein